MYIPWFWLIVIAGFIWYSGYNQGKAEGYNAGIDQTRNQEMGSSSPYLDEYDDNEDDDELNDWDSVKDKE